MGKQQRQCHYIIHHSTSEVEQLYQQLVEALDTLKAYFTEVRHLQNELNSQLSSFKFNIG